MKQFQRSYTDKNDLCAFLSSVKEVCIEHHYSNIFFYITFMNYDDAVMNSIFESIEQYFPDSIYYGNEASGNITMGDYFDGISINCYIFEKEGSYAKLAWVQAGTELSTLDDLWEYCNSLNGLKAIEMLPSLSYLDYLKIDCNKVKVSDDIFIFGGASCNYNLANNNTHVFAKDYGCTTEGMVVLLYFGENLKFTSDNILGWKGLGRLMEVTASEGKRILEIDHQPAFSVYEKYLNLSLEDSDITLFPLIVDENGTEFIRTPKIIYDDKSMTMFVNIPTRTMVRIAYGDKNTILDGIYSKSIAIAKEAPEVIKAYSCAGRRLFWGDLEVGKETQILEPIAPVNGFYTGGEILRFNNNIRVLNQTLCIITMSENTQDDKRKPIVLQEKLPDKSLVSRLAFFTQMVSKEQEEANYQLEEDKALLRENMGIISGLAEEYNALCYVNLDSEEYKVYSLDSKRLPYGPELFSICTNITELLNNFGNSEFVHPDDKNIFSQLNCEVIRSKLNFNKKFSVRFRQKFNNEFLWAEMDVIKYEPTLETAHSVAIGFAERDVAIRTEQAVTNCFNILGKDIAPVEAIYNLLSMAGDFYKADRCYIFEFARNKNFIYDSFEWCADNIISIKNRLQNVPIVYIDSWIAAYRHNGPLIIDTHDHNYLSVEGIKFFAENKINRVLSAPIINDNEIVGMVCIDNPTKAIDNYTVLTNASVVAYSEILKLKEKDEEHITLQKLTDTFVMVCYTDLARDYMNVWKFDDEYNMIFGKCESYSTIIDRYINSCVNKAERNICIEKTSPEYILKMFEGTDRFSIDVTDTYLGYDRNIVFDYIKVGSDKNQFVVSARDVTASVALEKKQQFELQEALAAADEANKSKTIFLFNMSHDIRTPMNAINGFTNMALKAIDNKEKAKDYLLKIQQSNDILLSLINSVLEVSRIEAGKAHIDAKPGNIYSSLYTLSSTMYQHANIKDIDISFDFVNITNQYVYCDFSRLFRILVNVITNAIKYTREGGRVKVICEQIESKNEKAVFKYTIEDNGIGMSEEFQKHVFEQFSREENVTMSGIQGTGLGLSVCKSFVDLLGGSIDFVSKQGEGSCFTIVLPLSIVTDEEEIRLIDQKYQNQFISSSSIDLKVFKGKRILLVEDNELNREIAAAILAEEQFVYEEAINGREAVDMVKMNGPLYYDCILMDIQMPIMGGYEAAHKIREAFPGYHIPIIALSANAYEEDKALSSEAGMDAHVAKPIVLEELLNELSRCLLKK